MNTENKQTSGLPTPALPTVGTLEINLHRLAGDESGFEASTRILRDSRGHFFCESGETAEEAMRALAEAICGNNPSSDATATRAAFKIVHDEREPRITRKEARDAIMLQLRKWREDGQDTIYFGALTIHPDLPDETTFGQLIDIAYDL